MALTITSNGESSNIASAIVQRDSTGSFSASTINHNPSSANTSYITGTTYSLTGSSTTPMVDVSGTWNTTGVATLLKANLTNTASGSNSKLLDLQISGATRFSVYTTGNIDTNSTARIGYLAQTDVSTVAGVSIANYGATFGATFTGMTNPGTAIAGYDGVLFSTGGVERVRIDSSGRLLVGTTSAITGISSQIEQIQLYGTGGAASSLAVHSVSDTLSANIRQYRARAGTTALLAGDAIGVNSFVGYTGTAWANVARIVGTVDSVSSGNLAGRMTFDTANTSGALIEAMRINASGNVGIGATSPNQKLTVAGNINLGGPPTRNQVSSTAIGVWTSDDPVDNDRANVKFVTVAGTSSSDSYITFNTNSYGVSGGERMRLDSSGNLGVGSIGGDYGRTWRFVARQDQNAQSNFGFINSTVGANANVTLTRIGGTGNNFCDWQLVDANGAPYDAFSYGSAVGSVRWLFGGTERARIDSSGNLIIGATSAASKLQVYGGASGVDTRATIGNLATALQLGVDSSNNALIATNTANSLIFYVNNTQRGYFTGTGLTVSDTVTAKQHDWTGEYGIGFITPTLDHAALAGGSLVLGDGALGDVLAFRTPTTSEYWNGTAWTSTTNLPGCFRGRLAFNYGAVYSLTSTNTRVRWTWNSWGYHFWDAFVMSGSANGNNLYLTVETSTNGTTWVTQINDQSFGGSWPGYHFYRQRGNNSTSNPYLRITVRRDSVNSNNVDIGNFSVIGAYSGMNRLIDWDADRHLTIYGNIASTKFKFDNEGSGVLFGYNSYLRFYNTNSNAEAIRILNSGGLAVGTTADPGAGAIYATGNITAYYSDRRLKTNIKFIDNALNKVLQLNGITYNANDIAKSFGYNQQENLVGLFADEVDKVLPEAVKPAPFDLDENGVSKSGENYKTIQYERLIPLLIEAIKEQQKIITDLKIKISKL